MPLEVVRVRDQFEPGAGDRLVKGGWPTRSFGNATDALRETAQRVDARIAPGKPPRDSDVAFMGEVGAVDLSGLERRDELVVCHTIWDNTIWKESSPPSSAVPT